MSTETVRLVCVSDTHNVLRQLAPSIPAGDVLVHAGDATMGGRLTEIYEFCEALALLPHQHKVFVAGNHDWALYSSLDVLSRSRGAPSDRSAPSDPVQAQTMLRAVGVTYLEDSGAEVAGLRFWGSPWQPEFCDWAFNLPRGEALRDRWALIPERMDVLVTHGPPRGRGDTVGCERVGCDDLRDAVREKRPRVHVFGHIHEGYGVSRGFPLETSTLSVNASSCDGRYRPVNAPVVLDVGPLGVRVVSPGWAAPASSAVL